MPDTMIQLDYRIIYHDCARTHVPNSSPIQLISCNSRYEVKTDNGIDEKSIQMPKR